MKTTKLFFALAIAASLAACTKEVLVEPEKAVDSFDDIKGAKVVANGFSIDPMSEAQTKVTVENGVPSWSDGDNAGVAWFVNAAGKVTDSQAAVPLNKLSATAYANHKLEYGEGRFQSNSNVYEGWHVAYYPYQEMVRPDELTFTVNPVMDKKINSNDDYGRELYENNILLSSAYHISNDVEGSVKVKDGVIQETMPLHFLTNILRPRFTLAPEFTAKEIKDLQIVSVTLSVKNNNLFAPTLTVNPAYFPTAGDGFEEEDFGKTGDKVALLADDASYTNSVTTIVSTENPEDYKLGAESLNFRMFIAPVPAPATALTAASFTVKVTLSDESSFTLQAGNDTESKNYKTFEKLAWCLNNDAKAQGNNLQTVNVDKNGILNPINLDLDLTVADYSLQHKAADYDEWCTAIDLAAAMGAEEVAIKVIGEIGFDTEHPLYTGDFESIKVTSGTKAVLAFANDITWSDKITLSKKVPVVVKADGVLTVGEKGLTTTGKITNDGTIVLVEGAKLPKGSIVNNGTIKVSVGSEIVAPTGAGKVVYTVDGTVVTAVIDDLIAKASLNTLVVNANLESDTALDWSALTVEMIKDAVLRADVTAAAIKVNEGEHAINGNITAPAVTVAEGASLSVDGNINGDVTVDGTADFNSTVINGALTINGDVTLAAEPYDVMNVTIITNNGDLVANTDVYVQEVYTNLGSTTNTIANGEYTIYYVSLFKYENNGGTTTGYIKPYTPVDPSLGYLVFDGKYFVKDDTGIANVLALDEAKIVVVLEDDIEINNTNLGGASTERIEIDANNHVITFKEDGSSVFGDKAEVTIKNAKIKRVATAVENQWSKHHLKFGCKVNLESVVLDNSILLQADANLKDVTISDNFRFNSGLGSGVYAIWIQPYGQTINMDNCKIYMNHEEGDGRGIKIEEEDLDGVNMCDPIESVTLTIKDSEIKTNTKAAILVNSRAGAEIKLDNVDHAETADKNNAVWIDKAMKDGSYFTNVIVDGCTKTVEP